MPLISLPESAVRAELTVGNDRIPNIELDPPLFTAPLYVKSASIPLGEALAVESV
jgi:hypothetical protein